MFHLHLMRLAPARGLRGAWIRRGLAAVLAVLIWVPWMGDGAEVDWMGRSRADVVAQLGKPLSALQRGDTEVLMYANNVRIEIRNDEVIAYRAGNAPVIVARDGTRYTPTDRGKVQREKQPEPVEEPAVPAPEVPREPAGVVEDAAGTGRSAEAEQKEKELEEEQEQETWTEAPALVPDAAEEKTRAMADQYMETGQWSAGEEEEETPPWANAVSAVIGAILRFGVALLMLRIAINWVGLPCYPPDVAKVAALYVVLREGIQGLGALGGHWEFVPLFRLGDVVGFFALCGLLYKFKIALSGITALKIAAATWLVTYFAMLILMVAVSFGLGSIF